VNLRDATFEQWMSALCAKTRHAIKDPSRWWPFYESGMSPSEALEAAHVLRRSDDDERDTFHEPRPSPARARRDSHRD
jgi:hypothetical protein